jgi:hypothetical protein
MAQKPADVFGDQERPDVQISQTIAAAALGIVVEMPVAREMSAAAFVAARG